MKRQADSQCIEKDKRNKTGTDEENPGTAPVYGQSSAQMTNPYIGWNASPCNPQIYSRPSSSQQGLIGSHHTYGHVPIYDPIRGQMNTSNNGGNTSAYTQQMHSHPSMLQGAVGASYPHYREEHFNQAGVFAVRHRAYQTGRAQRENSDATAYNRQAMMQPTTSHQPWAQFREEHFNQAGVSAVGHRAHQTGRAQVENSDAIAYNRQAMMPPTTSHQPWAQFREQHFNPVFAVGNRAYHSDRAQAENSDVTAHNRQTMMQLPTHHHAGTQFRLGSGDQLQHSTNDLRYTPMHVVHYVNDGSLVQQMHPHPSMLQGALAASYPHYNAIAYNQQLMMQRTLPYHFGTQFREEHFNPTGVSAVGHRAHQTGRAQRENSDATAYNQQMLSQPSTLHHAETQFRSGSSNQLQRSTNDLRCTSMHSEQYANDSSPVHQQTAAQPSTFQLGQTASNQNSGEQHAGPLRDPTIEKGLHQTDKEKAGSGTVVNVQQATNVYQVRNGTVINQQMLPQPSTSETEQNAATSRTIASCHEALQKLREILKDYDSRECNGRVTEDYDELTEPSEEVYPKVLLLLKFYRGDLLKKMLQYQKDPAFKYKSKAASSDKKMDYKTFLRRIMETETKRISLIAQAGSGKTVMLKRLARDLAKHNDELLIFFMNFRDFTDSKEITPCDFLINGRLPDSDAKLSYAWILENQDKVILVLDGLDQAIWDVDENAALVGSYGRGKVSEIVSSLFKRKLFPGIKVVYSSREHAVASLKGELRPEMVFALIGLSPGDSEWLFKSFLQKDGEILWEKLRTQSHSLIPLLSIPAFLVFTAIVYVNKPENPPRSMTEVLKNLLEIFMRSGHIVEKEIPVVMKGLKKMSFCGMRDGKVLFLIVDVQNAGLDFQKICDWIIRIPGLNQRNQFLLEGDYVLIFSHQIIQEFLAAQYIIEEDIKSFKKIVNQYLKKSSWSVVARFVSGLLLNDEISADLDKDPDIELKKTSLKKMLKKRYEGLKISSPDLLATISESNCDDFIRDSLQRKKLDVRRLDDSDAYIIGSAMRHLTCLNELRFESCSLRHEALQIIWNLIENSSLKISKLNFSDIKLDTGTFVIIGDIVQRCSVEELMVRDCKLAGGSLTIVRFTGTKTFGLYLHDTKLKDIGYAALGKIVKTLAVDQLELCGCNLTDGKLKNLMIEVEGAKILKIDITSNSDMEDEGYATLGKIVKMCAVDQLLLRWCKLSDGKLKNLLSKTDGAKILKINISFNSDIEDEGYATLGKIVKMCAVDELWLQGWELSDGKLKNLLSETDGAKISKLDVSGNPLNEDTAAMLGDIVKQCSVEDLTMHYCKLNDGSLKTLLSRSTGAKLSFIDVRNNDFTLYGKPNNLSSALLDEISRSITVEHKSNFIR